MLQELASSAASRRLPGESAGTLVAHGSIYEEHFYIQTLLEPMYLGLRVVDSLCSPDAACMLRGASCDEKDCFFLASQQLLLKSIPAGETAGTRV